MQAWNGLAHDGSIWQDVDLFEFQRDVEVSRSFGQTMILKVEAYILFCLLYKSAKATMRKIKFIIQNNAHI